MNLDLKQKIALYCKGIAMGAADIVPGVSGGTVALITGIYDELLSAIQAINFKRIEQITSGDIKGLWKSCNGSFLIILLSGIATSIIGLSGPILYALQHHPESLRGFFFGLILASAHFVAKNCGPWRDFPKWTACLGFVIAAAINQIPALQGSDSKLYLSFCGAIAICAMILPGISGSFILLLLGSYDKVLHAIKNFEIAILLTFATGCVIGLLSFSHALGYALKHHYKVTMALLTGFMLGSLQKIWPWRITTHWRINSHGEQVPWLDTTTLPQSSMDLLQIFFCAFAGFIIVYSLEFIGSKNKS